MIKVDTDFSAYATPPKNVCAYIKVLSVKSIFIKLEEVWGASYVDLGESIA